MFEKGHWKATCSAAGCYFVLSRLLVAPNLKFFLVIGKFFKYYFEFFLKDDHRFYLAINRTHRFPLSEF